MNEEKFNKSLSKFLEKETYIMVYRTNYDSAREFNNELINYIKQLQQENKQLKEELKYTVPIVEHNKIVSEKLNEIRQLKEEKEELKKWLEEKMSIYEYQEASNFYVVLDKIKELEEGE